MDNDYNIKPFNITLTKTSTYVKIYDAETKRMYLFDWS